MISNGVGIDSTQTVAATTRIFDIRSTARPLTVRLAVAAGETLTIATSTSVPALSNENDPSWTVIRTRTGAYHTETFINTSTNLVGIRVRRTAGAVGTSTARVFAALTPAQPRYDPFIDRNSAGHNDARRLLDQGTMGPLEFQAETFSGTIGAWITAQAALNVPTIDFSAWPGNGDSNMSPLAATLDNLFCENTAQLRMRMAWAISQIVCSGISAGSCNPNGMSWWQGLFTNSLANYSDILRHCFMHRHMGFFLNNLGNSARGIAPSQNFAREWLQLFSTGVFALNKDGSQVLDGNGRPVNAYAQPDVASIARYASGWALPFAPTIPGNEGTPVNGDMMPYGSTLGYDGVVFPLFGKTDADYPSFAQIANPTNTNIIDRREAIIAITMQQPSVGPYVCKQLIQKLVTDNPSPQYIRRVVAAWDNNGSGVVGSLTAVARAILLDTEARGLSKPITSGRVCELLLQNTRRKRYAKVQANPSYVYGVMWATNYNSGTPIYETMGNRPGVPVSVFNDFPFAQQAAGVEAPAAVLWKTPAILSNLTTMSAANFITDPAAMAVFDATGRWDVTALIALYDTTFAATGGDTTAKKLAAHTAMVNRVYADLNQGAAPVAAELTELVGFMTDIDTQGIGTRAKGAWLISLVLTLPRTAIVV